MTIVLLIAGIILFGTVGDLILSHTMKRIGDLSVRSVGDAFRVAGRVLTSPGFILGVACMAGAFFSLLAALSQADVSLVEPATSLSFVLNTIGAKFLLKENVDRSRWTGTLLITLGAYLLFIRY
jgi:drug/metabolite transporter (DMT)-like permease